MPNKFIINEIYNKINQERKIELINLNDIDSPLKIISEIKKKTKRLDILINNAGVMKENTVEEISLEEWNNHLTINLTAPFLLIKHST